MTKDQIRFIEECMDAPEKLTDWENEFIDDLSCLDDDYKLSDRQAMLLNKINGKVL